MFCKKAVLRNFANSQGNTCARVSILIKWQACNFIKIETLAQVFSCEFCEISKNTFSYRTPPVAASATFLKSTCLISISLLLPFNLLQMLFSTFHCQFYYIWYIFLYFYYYLNMSNLITVFTIEY